MSELHLERRCSPFLRSIRASTRISIASTFSIYTCPDPLPPHLLLSRSPRLQVYARISCDLAFWTCFCLAEGGYLMMPHIAIRYDLWRHQRPCVRPAMADVYFWFYGASVLRTPARVVNSQFGLAAQQKLLLHHATVFFCCPHDSLVVCWNDVFKEDHISLLCFTVYRYSAG